MQEYYYETSITVDKFRDEIESFLMDHFYNGIEERGNTLILRSEDPLSSTLKKLEEYVKSLEEIFDETISLKIEQEKKRNSDWIEKFKKSITPVEVGEFYIYPGWYEPKEGKISIQIDPALAFGSGHHETTRGCLLALQKYVKKGDSVLDVGTGSGILAIAATKLGADVDICDTDELAIKEAKKNFALNSAEFQHAWIGSAANAKKKYDIVIANIVADVLMMIARDLKNATNEGGILILSGIIEKYRDKVYEKFALPLVEEIQEGEWITMILQNRGANE
ncbi:50S ribosomal protein L11 methyltransferase [Nitratiruptor tergarcus]|uniref:Ribosomal protein L11 methyltransferase n=1 Tax=Nitratiruptor tergarcus DSM 16512 TaxID=1069081 RepID=A0A1W1WVB9_9BACT|nr:50S ribosomal protein L11 methyltransferase [Nitratiruptor tergarcus]SMC10129.1 ribosomal protein L11 methyltransferase [Nitratiruptor tergarcus DSM 16512]